MWILWCLVLYGYACAGFFAALWYDHPIWLAFWPVMVVVEIRRERRLQRDWPKARKQ